MEGEGDEKRKKGGAGVFAGREEKQGKDGDGERLRVSVWEKEGQDLGGEGERGQV